MNKVVYAWPEDAVKYIDSKSKNCHTCAYATITIIGECDKKINGEYVHQGGLCPSVWLCKHWKQADEFTMKMNGFDWSKATRIDVD